MARNLTDAGDVRAIAASIAAAADRLEPVASELDWRIGTQLRAALRDLRAIDSNLWEEVDSLEEEHVLAQ